MFGILGKFWILGGSFYLLLVIAVILFWVGGKKFDRFLNLAVVICAAALAIYFSFNQLIKLSNNEPNLFLRPLTEKLDSETFGQYSYSLHLKKILPQEANGCIIWSWDLPTFYLQSELYPRLFVIKKGVSDDCYYVISQFGPLSLANFNLIDTYNSNYLYKRNN